MLRHLGIALSATVLFSAISANAGREVKKDPEELICKQQKRTGTRFATRVCYTRKQWAELSETNKRTYAETRDRPVIDVTREK